MCHICNWDHLDILYPMVPRFPSKAFLFLRAQKTTAQSPKSPLNRDSSPEWPRHDHLSSLLCLALWAIVAHSPWSCRVFFFFPLTKGHFNSAGVLLVTEVALPLPWALRNGYSQVLGHSPHTKQYNCKRETGNFLGKERWEVALLKGKTLL